MKRSVLPFVLFLFLVVPIAQAQTPAEAAQAASALEVVVPGCPSGEELVNPDELTATDGKLSTEFDVRERTASVPVYTSSGCKLTTFSLRNYGYKPKGSSTFVYGFPGPTLRLHKAVASRPGDSFSILLTNNLKYLGPDKCNQGCGSCTGSNPPQCCSDAGKFPDCFHGDNTTNLHFHGMHVSPQSPQDYVLLNLLPATAPDPSPNDHTMHGDAGTVAKGSFRYTVSPIPWNQSEGTHWYHPHKHGSTALQVGNGMAGAVIVEGPFDDWLNEQFPAPPKEKVMVVQQVHDLNFYTSAFVFAATPLINGKLMPTVTMYPGEIQRWRVIAATMEASAQFTIDFDGPSGTSGIAVKQIAMDGIQFAPKNYEKQPLVNYPAKTFNLSPGNRADFLVKAPTTPGIYRMTYSVFGRVEGQGTGAREAAGKLKGKLAPVRENVNAILEELAPGAAEPALLTVKVVPCEPPAVCPAMDFPKTLPELPIYLSDIDKVDGSHSVLFSLEGKPLAQPQVFAIGLDGGKPQQYMGDCASVTSALDRAEEWTITQNQNSGIGKPFHVFHIHVNPFQVRQNGADAKGNPIIYDPPIWMDSVTLPDIDNDATDAERKVVMRMRYEDYTGLYVMHCHFLGHEDRGMMLTVQTVCPNDPSIWGKTVANGGPDNCQIEARKALKPCPTGGEAEAQATPAPPRERLKKH